MQQVPPRSGPDGRRGAALPLRPTQEPVSKLFSTGQHSTLEGANAATKRSERGSRIVSDLRRTIIYAAIFLGVGLILALFVSTLWG
ncbi:MAG TPA: hypothetical protein VHJ20_02600 [Polyangia bacterium]|nr:hypothetical protein [Polyangia bacterium]